MWISKLIPFSGIAFRLVIPSQIGLAPRNVGQLRTIIFWTATASKNDFGQWHSQPKILGRDKMFDFRRITVFYLG